MRVRQEIKEKIVGAANALAAEGNESPTNDQVRERMGGGSLSHISPVMREWRESRKSEVAAALEIPADLKKVIETSVGQVWATASKLASASIEAVRQDAEVAIEAATAERDEALEEVRRLEEKLIQLEEAASEKDQVIADLQDELKESQKERLDLTGRCSTISTRLEDRDEQLKSLKAELKEVRADNKALQADLVEIARGRSEQGKDK